MTTEMQSAARVERGDASSLINDRSAEYLAYILKGNVTPESVESFLFARFDYLLCCFCYVYDFDDDIPGDVMFIEYQRHFDDIDIIEQFIVNKIPDMDSKRAAFYSDRLKELRRRMIEFAKIKYF